jgi:hypothetical protein
MFPPFGHTSATGGPFDAAAQVGFSCLAEEH